MFRSSGALAGILICLAIPARAQETSARPDAGPLVRDIRIVGAREAAADAIQDAAGVRVGGPLPVSPDRVGDLAERVVRYYRSEGYTFAEATAAFDVASGQLSISIDEGVIGAVEFTGVDDRLNRIFTDEFALKAGDVFNRRRAVQALEVLLRPTRGAVRPGRIFERDRSRADRQEPGSEPGPYDRGRTFDLVDRNGQRVLLVGLDEPAGRFKLVPDLGDRENWFTSVDGFVPSLGFGAAVFDRAHFNHAYAAGHLSYKTAADRAGYTIGFERPFFAARRLYVGGELRDLTASDDQWQSSSLEASLAAIGPRRSLRDYYRQRGLQIDAAWRVHPRLELLAAWRTERHEPLGVESDFSFWHNDESFRPNRAAAEGRLHALVIGASVDGAGFERESLDATYRRHQLQSLFGERLDAPRTAQDPTAIWRLDWTSEISAPDAFGSDFDFRRHIVAARYRKLLSPHQEFAVRGIAGWSGGTLPPQRLFGIGGYGSVHGYDFKESVGTSLALMNLEYALGWRNGFKLLGFYDTGRTASGQEWLKGVGFGIGAGDFRIDFGYRLSAVPDSLHVVLRFERPF